MMTLGGHDDDDDDDDLMMTLDGHDPRLQQTRPQLLSLLLTPCIFLIDGDNDDHDGDENDDDDEDDDCCDGDQTQPH